MVIQPEKLYILVGERIKEVRNKTTPTVTQAKLAKKVGLSRASIVNIESGRQRAPLHILWNIAEVLDTDLTYLIPSYTEFKNNADSITLDDETLAKIESSGNKEAQDSIREFISKTKRRLSENE